MRTLTKEEKKIWNEALDALCEDARSNGNFISASLRATCESFKEKYNLNEEPALVAGKWYEADEGMSLVCVTKGIDEISFMGYGFYNGDWCGSSSWWWNLLGWKKADVKSVVTMLLHEAIVRGFVEGAHFKMVPDPTAYAFNQVVFKVGDSGVSYKIDEPNQIVLHINGNVIFKDGIWAEIVNPPKTIGNRLQNVESELERLNELFNQFKS